ncbi:MAG TPA: Hsp33 family molecular chaperone HslO, partial [Steroidobacteraceae bacterium]|nr:Hsp33 family molecular chaperone HslO [Steroidobacteraceae bacterium]
MDASNLHGDAVRRFTVENQPVRGHFVRMAEAWRVLREHRDHPAPVRELLGEAVSASVLLAATLKFRGTLTLQLQGGSGAVRLLVAQCTHDFRVRAVVRVDEERLGGAAGSSAALTTEMFHRLVGTGGRLAVTVEAAERGGARYQGIVPLEGDSFAECLEAYFATSEQLPTRVRLAADDTHAAGLLIQKLPGERGAQEATEVRAAWNDAQQGI